MSFLCCCFAEATCNYARDHAMRKLQAESDKSVYVPNCTADGHYAPKQCDLIFNICWCVKSDGKLVHGTVVESAEPSCTTGSRLCRIQNTIHW